MVECPAITYLLRLADLFIQLLLIGLESLLKVFQEWDTVAAVASAHGPLADVSGKIEVILLSLCQRFRWQRFDFRSGKARHIMRRMGTAVRSHGDGVRQTLRALHQNSRVVFCF